AQGADKIADEGTGTGGVHDVPGAILQPQNLAGLGEGSEQRVVARVLGMMRIVTADRPRDLPAGTDDRAVEIHGEAAQSELLDVVAHQLMNETAQRIERAAREGLEPIHDRPLRRNAKEPTEAVEQKIVGHELQMLEATSSDHEESDDDERK